MATNYYYFVFDVSFNGLRYAYYDRIKENKNMINLFINCVEVVLPCKTRKQAKELVCFLNERYKANGVLWKDFINDEMTLVGNEIEIHPIHFHKSQLMNFIETHEKDLLDIIREVQ